MNNDIFTVYLKKLKIRESKIRRIIKSVAKLEKHIFNKGKQLELLCLEDIDIFLDEHYRKSTSNFYVDDLKYYYKFIYRNDILEYLDILKYKYTPPVLIKNLNIKNEYVLLLKKHDIKTNNQLLYRCKYNKDRISLSEKTKISLSEIVNLVKLCDLTRIYAVKGTRAKLYLESGLDTVEKISNVKPYELIDIVTSYINNSKFDGIPTLPKEARFTIEFAKRLPQLIVW